MISARRWKWLYYWLLATVEGLFQCLVVLGSLSDGINMKQSRNMRLQRSLRVIIDGVRYGSGRLNHRFPQSRIALR